jgi:hypothetical protein
MYHQRIPTTQMEARNTRGGGSSTALPQQSKPNIKELNTMVANNEVKLQMITAQSNRYKLQAAEYPPKQRKPWTRQSVHGWGQHAHSSKASACEGA